MKKSGLIISILLVIAMVLCVVACEGGNGVTIAVDSTKPVFFEINSEVDFTGYFIIIDNGTYVPTTKDMLDLSAVDFSKAGTFEVSCSYQSQKASVTITVADSSEVPPSYDQDVTINIVEGLNTTFSIGDAVDFKDYFEVKKGVDRIYVTDDMLDLSNVDLSKEGTFTVTCTYQGTSFTATFTVEDQLIVPPEIETADLSKLLAMFEDYESWNFRVNVVCSYNGEEIAEDYYWYKGLDAKFQYEGLFEDENGDEYTETCIDYLQYDITTETYWYIIDYYGDGDYYKYSEDSFTYYYYMAYIYYSDPNLLLDIDFVEKDGAYIAVDANEAGVSFIGEFEGEEEDEVLTYTSFIVKFSDGKLASVEAKLSDGYIYTYEFCDYGKSSFTIPNAIEDDDDGDDWGNWGDDDDDDQTSSGSLTSTFIGADLSVGKGELEYTSNVGASSLDETRGLQFMQANGAVTLISKSSVDGVTSVTVFVTTNADKGMKVSVKVGGTSLTCDNETSYKVYKPSNWYELETLTFTSSKELSGKVEVTLTPTQSKKSMYILTISINGDYSQGSSSSGGNTSTGSVMEEQVYDEKTFSKDNLQDKIMAEDGGIGLPSTGDLNVLVIPVQLMGETITQSQIDKLKLAFNGTSTDTGWESVSSFYSKSSYGKLNLTFDFSDVVQAKNNSKYYERYSSNYETGSDLLLQEALEALDSKIDFSKYDTNGDGYIDAVYIIYSSSVDYNSNDSFYWAYVTYYPNDEKYDGVTPYYYMFAGFDFMDESTSDYGIEINAMTYIHETGHLLGLDDYYDYYEYQGCNEGLGGADMMDYNTGDHGAYSKIMLGWMDANIVTTTKTVTISALADKGECILVPLDFDNSYFSEYLIIDLYSAKGLNELESIVDGSILYDGAAYGVRIYHVTSWVDKPCDEDEYYSITNYNNSITDIALIKLIQADGGKNFKNTNGYTQKSDLWQAGDVFSQVFSSYTRNNGDLLNFDIKIDSVSADSATITITFATAA